MIYHLLIDVAMGFYARYQITKTICHKNMSLHTSFPVYEKYLKIISIEWNIYNIHYEYIEQWIFKMIYEYPRIYICMNLCTNMIFLLVVGPPLGMEIILSDKCNLNNIIYCGGYVKGNNIIRYITTITFNQLCKTSVKRFFFHSLFVWKHVTNNFLYVGTKWNITWLEASLME